MGCGKHKKCDSRQNRFLNEKNDIKSITLREKVKKNEILKFSADQVHRCSLSTAQGEGGGHLMISKYF
jgi:hypothetical protein